MTGPSLQKKGFANAVINALSSNICVLDRNARIIAVNLAWQNFGAENFHRRASDIGSNYLSICQNSFGAGSEEAEEFAAGVRAVLDGNTPLFQKEYPCHSPTASRWFLGRVTPLDLFEGGAVISHENITSRRLLENELEKLAATDPLTGLPNRRYFLDMAGVEAEKVRRFDAQASIIMMDVDAFKAVNDRLIKNRCDTMDDVIKSSLPRFALNACHSRAQTVRRPVVTSCPLMRFDPINVLNRARKAHGRRVEIKMSVVASFLHRDGVRIESVPLEKATPPSADNEFVWIGLHEPKN